jgi:alkyl hydroperoxide reductase subunit AhpC
LLADFHPKGEVAQAYGFWREDKGYSRRAIVIINPQGVVRYSKVIERGAPDIEHLLNIVRNTAMEAGQRG